jgi:hypothetical protein
LTSKQFAAKLSTNCIRKHFLYHIAYDNLKGCHQSKRSRWRGGVTNVVQLKNLWFGYETLLVVMDPWSAPYCSSLGL